MIEIWYAVLAAMLCAYLILDGWNIGAGITLFAIGADQQERRAVIRALGSSWSLHEVWLIGFGGTLFMAFPVVYAATFAGFYLAFFPLLWSLILRGVAMEVRDLVDDPLCEAIIESVKRTNKVLIVHEESLTRGIGAQLSAIVSEELLEYLDGPVTQVAAPNVAFSSAPPSEAAYLPNAEKILSAARALAAY